MCRMQKILRIHGTGSPENLLNRLYEDLDKRSLHVVGVCLREIVWALVKHVHIKNTKLLTLSLHNRNTFKNFVLRIINSITDDGDDNNNNNERYNRLAEFLKIIYNKNYMKELTIVGGDDHDVNAWNDLKDILIVLDDIFNK